MLIEKLVVTSSAAASGTVTYWLVPLKPSAPLLTPLVRAGELTSEPGLLPAESSAELPLPSSNFQCATNCTGGTMTLVTVSVKLSLAVSALSVTMSVMTTLPVCPAAGVMARVRFAPLPPRTRLELGTSVWLPDEAVTPRLPGEVSPSPIVKGIGTGDWPLPAERLARSEMIGAVLPGVTVSVNTLLAVSNPSLTPRVTVAVPDCPDAGVTVTARFAPLPLRTMAAFGTRFWSDEVAEIVRLPDAVSASPMLKAKGEVGVSRLVVCARIGVMVGASFTAVTVTVKVRLAEAMPSLTVTVTSAEPLWFAAGVTVTVRLAPEPPNVTFAFGTSAGLEEAAESNRLPAEVSASATVNETGPSTESSGVFWLLMAEMVGGVLAIGGPD